MNRGTSFQFAFPFHFVSLKNDWNVWRWTKKNRFPKLKIYNNIQFELSGRIGFGWMLYKCHTKQYNSFVLDWNTYNQFKYSLFSCILCLVSFIWKNAEYRNGKYPNYAVKHIVSRKCLECRRNVFIWKRVICFILFTSSSSLLLTTQNICVCIRNGFDAARKW